MRKNNICIYDHSFIILFIVFLHNTSDIFTRAAQYLHIIAGSYIIETVGKVDLRVGSNFEGRLPYDGSTCASRLKALRATLGVPFARIIRITLYARLARVEPPLKFLLMASQSYIGVPNV